MMNQARVVDHGDEAGARKTERWALLAYERAGLEPGGMEGVGELLVRLFQNPAVVDIVDAGVARGRAELAFHRLRDVAPYPITARILSGQSDEQLTLSAACACARYMEWVAGESWDDGFVQAVAMAIAMPLPAIREDLAAGLSLTEIAEAYVVDPLMVGQRARMLRGGHDSGERPAFTPPDETLTRIRLDLPRRD